MRSGHSLVDVAGYFDPATAKETVKNAGLARGGPGGNGKGLNSCGEKRFGHFHLNDLLGLVGSQHHADLPTNTCAVRIGVVSWFFCDEPMKKGARRERLGPEFEKGNAEGTNADR